MSDRITINFEKVVRVLAGAVELRLDQDTGKLSLWDKYQTKLSEVDFATEKIIKDIKYDSSTEELVFSFNNSPDIRVVIGDIFEFDDYYTKEQSDTLRLKLEELLENKKVDKTIKINGYSLNKDVNITKSDVGLGRVDNTSDTEKPISKATQEALNNVSSSLNNHKEDTSNPHNVTAAQLGLGNVLNVPSYSKSENDTKLAAAQEEINRSIDSANEALLNHKNDHENPHTVTKTQIGLGAVNNVAITEEQVSQIGINKSDIDSIKEVNETQNTNITRAQTTADEAKSIAQGRAKAVVFDTLVDMITYMKSATAAEFNVGDHLYIKALDVSDYWVSAILDNNTGTYGYYQVSTLETPKVDLSEYQKKILTTIVNIDGTEKDIIEGAIDELINQKLSKKGGTMQGQLWTPAEENVGVRPTQTNTGSIGGGQYHYKIGFINDIRSYQIYPIAPESISSESGLGELGNETYRWGKAYINKHFLDELNASEVGDDIKVKNPFKFS